MPNKWTFKIEPIRNFVKKWVEPNGDDWVDPFCGQSDFCEYQNDIAETHTDALTYLNQFIHPVDFEGAIFDPPYSLEQIKRSYASIGVEDWQRHCGPNGGFPEVKDAIGEVVKRGGIVLSFGWNSNGMGRSRGFKKLELLVVAHGGNHHDTLCLAEQKT